VVASVVASVVAIGRLTSVVPSESWVWSAIDGSTREQSGARREPDQQPDRATRLRRSVLKAAEPNEAARSIGSYQ